MSTIRVVPSLEPYDTVAATTSAYFSLEGKAEAELMFVSSEEIRALNERMRGVNRITDVLSFPFLTLTAGRYLPFTPRNYAADVNPRSKAVGLGSIVICDEVARAQAEEYGHDILRERAYLFLHGLLHLLGFDHMRDDEKEAMRRAEEDILSSVGLNR